MKILACYKIARDTEHITPAELCALRDGSLDLTVFKKKIGTYEEAALENSLRLADAVRKEGGAATVHAVTVGDCDDRFAKDLLALGFDDVYRIPAQNTDPEQTALYICGLINHSRGYDAIFTGRQSGPNENGLVPYFIATHMQLPCISDVLDIKLRDSEIFVTAKTDVGTRTLTVKRVAVYIMGDAAHPFLRIATLREKLAVSKKAMIEYIPAIPVGRIDPGKHICYIFHLNEKNCDFIHGDSMEEKVMALWNLHLRELINP